MGGISNYLAAKVLDGTLRNVVYTPSTQAWCGLFTVAPTASSGSGTEVTGGAYVRLPFTPLAAATSGTPAETANSTQLLWAVSTGNYGGINGFVLAETSSAGSNVLYWSTLTTVTVNTNDQANFAVGAIVVTLT